MSLALVLAGVLLLIAVRQTRRAMRRRMVRRRLFLVCGRAR